jgi:hypothetical protein
LITATGAQKLNIDVGSRYNFLTKDQATLQLCSCYEMVQSSHVLLAQQQSFALEG